VARGTVVHASEDDAHGEGGEPGADWVRDYNGRGLAATCKDTGGDVYTTVSYDDRNFVVDGSQIPEWDDESIERHWRVSDWASLAHDREGPFPFETH
jgi:hypothetical protein